MRGGTVRRLLLAKSRLHARWAEALLKSDGGGPSAETARALDEMKAARANDLVIAASVVEILRRLEGLTRGVAGVGGSADFDASRASANGTEAEFEEELHRAGALLAWMPRGQTFYRLSAARCAYADALWWQGKARQSKSLLVSASGFRPDPLKELKLDAGQFSAAAAANWNTAARYTRLAEQSTPRTRR